MPPARSRATTIEVSKEEHDVPQKAKNDLTRENRGLESENKKLGYELKGKEAELKDVTEERDRLKRNYDSLMTKMQNKRKKAKTTKHERADDIDCWLH